MIYTYLSFEKPLLSEQKPNQRLEFALQMKKELRDHLDLLNYLVFSDEPKLCLFENQIGGNVELRCRSEKKLEP
jgi:hypothetical protein